VGSLGVGAEEALEPDDKDKDALVILRGTHLLGIVVNSSDGLLPLATCLSIIVRVQPGAPDPTGHRVVVRGRRPVSLVAAELDVAP
jgi:hypothetical protein